MRISDWSSDVCSSDLRYNHRFGDGKSTDYNFFVNAGHDIGTLELYAFGSYGIRDANAAGFYGRSHERRNRYYGASLTDFVPFYPNVFLTPITSETGDVPRSVGLMRHDGGDRQGRLPGGE